MNKRINTDSQKLKYFFILCSVLITIVLSFINYQGKLVSALSGFSCNHYTGQCFVDSKYAKYTDKNTCSGECLKSKFKYYCNTQIQKCVLDFRGTYSDETSCWNDCKKKIYIITDGYPQGVDYTTYYDNLRPFTKVYYCAKEQKKCIFKSQIYMGDETFNGERIDLNNQYNYYDCWSYCMKQSLDKIPAKTIYTCDDGVGTCKANPSGEYIGISGCEANCKKRDYTNVKYICDTTKGCVESAGGNMSKLTCLQSCKRTD